MGKATEYASDRKRLRINKWAQEFERELQKRVETSKVKLCRLKSIIPETEVIFLFCVDHLVTKNTSKLKIRKIVVLGLSLSCFGTTSSNTLFCGSSRMPSPKQRE